MSAKLVIATRAGRLAVYQLHELGVAGVGTVGEQAVEQHSGASAVGGSVEQA